MLSIAFAGLYIWLINRDTKRSELSYFAGKVTDYIGKQEPEIRSFLRDSTLISEIVINSQSAYLPENAINYTFSSVSKNFSAYIYLNDKMVFWSDNSIVPPFYFLYETQHEIQRKLVKINGGNMLLYCRSIKINPQNIVKCIVLLPLKTSLSASDKKYKDIIKAKELLPDYITVQKTPGGEPFYMPDNAKGGYLIYPDAAETGAGSWYLLVLYLLSGISLLYTLSRLSLWIMKRFNEAAGAVFIIAMVILLRLFSLNAGHFSNLFHYTFSGYTNSPVNSSIPDTLLNSILFFWLCIFLCNNIPIKPLKYTNRVSSLLFVVLNYIIIISGLLFVTFFCKEIVTDSQIVFDFDNVFNLDWLNLGCVFGIILLLYAFYIIAHRCTYAIHRLKVPLLIKFGTFAFAYLLTFPLIGFFSLNLPLFTFSLCVLIIVVLFDIFLEVEKPNITWLIIWMVIFSGFTSTLLYKYNKDKDLENRNLIARAYLSGPDTIAFNRVDQTVKKIRQRKYLQTLTKADSSNIFQLNQNINSQYLQFFNEDEYLKKYYNFRIEIVGKEKTDNNTVDTSVNDLKTPGNYNNLVIRKNKNDYFHYYITSDIENNKNYQLKIELIRNSGINENRPSWLSGYVNFKNIANINNYDYAIYKNGVLRENKGFAYERTPSVYPDIPIGQGVENIINERSEYIYRISDSEYMWIGRELSGLIKPISLFSYLFILIVFTTLTIGVINKSLKVFPKEINFYLSGNESIRNKIQISFLTLIIFSFLFIGIVTVFYFKNSSKNRNILSLKEKLSSVQSDLMNQLPLIDSGKTVKVESLEPVVKVLSAVHQLPINLYDLEGNIIVSSEYDIFKKNIISKKISPIPYWNLLKNGKLFYINPHEEIGSTDYSSAYNILHNKDQSNLAILNIPDYYASEYNNSTLKEFLGTLLNVYVFLLLVSGAIALAVANTISKPIVELGKKLSRFRLGRQNETIYWKNPDEIGILIKEYNDLIGKLAISAEMMAQNERDSAWREMAKQVAHEIKNPLTPMKLSIQYLQYASDKTTPEELQDLVKRCSDTLIEQIDNLTRIAGEFSNFGKIPTPDLEKFILNDLVISVYDLFKNRTEVEFNLYVPIDEIYVDADRSYLLRVLNNLIKNATQAIPEDRKGVIDIKLEEQEGKAVITITDNGSGISDDMKDKVFYPNFTTKSSGTGLGLAISKDIIEALKGKIYFETKADEGTTFTVELPTVENQ